MDTQSETLFCNRAATYLMMRKYHEALQDAIRVIEIDPNHVKGHWRAGKAHLYLGTFEHARTFYTTARRVATSAQDADAIEAESKVIDWVERCRRCLRTREWKEALQLAENVLCVLPAGTPCNTPWECLRIEAMIHVDPQQASSLSQRLCAEEPSYSEAWYLRAKALFYCTHDAVSTSTALNYIQKCMSLEDGGARHVRAATLQTCIETFSRLRDEGNHAYANGQWSEAHAAYTKALSIDPCNGSLRGITLCNRAAVHIQAERWKEGLDDITQSIQLNPLNAKAYARRARIFQHFGQHDEAVRDLQQAVKLYPSAENQERLAQASDMLKNGTSAPNTNSTGPNTTNTYSTFGNGGGPPRQTARPQQRPQSAGGSGRSQSNPARPRTASSGPEARRGSAPTTQAPTYYDVLGVRKDCDERTLTKMYREAALKWHPDKWMTFDESQQQVAETNFKEISQAYSTLRDTTRRRQYDMTLP
jgi:tetratricopeptide (TPR) repeat protein